MPIAASAISQSTPPCSVPIDWHGLLSPETRRLLRRGPPRRDRSQSIGNWRRRCLSSSNRHTKVEHSCHRQPPTTNALHLGPSRHSPTVRFWLCSFASPRFSSALS